MLRITSVAMNYVPLRASPRSRVAANGRPVFSWSVDSDRNNAHQTAYRMTAGGHETGWIQSTEQRASLGDYELPAGEPVEIGIAIRDNFGNESPVRTEIVYNGEKAWDAPWIGMEAETSRPVYLRRGFYLPQEVRAARLYHCGLGYASVCVNGHPVDDSRLDPAFTDYSKRISYGFTPDVRSFLRCGDNDITAVVAPGWRRRSDDATEPFAGPMQFSAILEWLDASGEWRRIATDEEWQVDFGPIVQASLFDGEIFDAGIAAFESPRRAKVLPAPGGKMEPMTLPPIAQHALHAPVAVWNDGEDAVIMDFGQNIAGVLRVPLSGGERGARVVLTHSEELTEDGRLYRATLRTARARDEYRFSSDECDLTTWQPCFTYHGFRYARVEGVSHLTDPWAVRAVELRTDVDKNSFFRCGNPIVNRIHEICVATERANQHSLLTDCPQRDERMGWMNDATVRFDATPYHSEMGAFFPKIVHDIMDVQREDGAIGCTAPFLWGNIPADPVCSSFLVAGLQAYLHDGNLELIREAYPAWDAWEKKLLSCSDGYIVNYSYYGDWAGPVDCCRPEPNGVPGAVSAVTPGIFMSTGYSYLNCRLLEFFARELGWEEEAQRHGDTAERIRQAMLERWYDAESGSFATGSQGCLSFALYLGIAPEPKKTALRLHQKLEDDGGRLTTGNLCSRYILDALAEHGWLEDAWRLMNRMEYPSLGYMISQEATTVWERFELMKDVNMNSHNHPMYAAADYWLYAYIAGVRPTSAGWKTCSIKPYMPEKLNSTQATVDTPLGPVSVRWTRRYGQAHLQAQIPFGMRADIEFCGRKANIQSGFFTMSVDI